MRSGASTVDGVLARSAARWPARVALRFADREWSYAELDAAVSRAAGALLAIGLERGDRVAAYGRNSDAYLLGFLACSRAGLVHVPVNYALTGDELAYLLEQSGSRAVLFDPALSRRSRPSAATASRSRCATPGTRCWSAPARATSPRSTTRRATRISSSCSTRPARPPARRAR